MEKLRFHRTITAGVARETAERSLIDTIRASATSSQFVIVDLEGVASQAATFAVSQADMVIIPCGPSYLDAVEAAAVLKVVKACEQMARQPITIPAAVLFTKTSPAIKPDTLREIERPVRYHAVSLRHGASLCTRGHGFIATIFSRGVPLHDLDPAKIHKLDAAIKNAEAFMAETIRRLDTAHTGKERTMRMTAPFPRNEQHLRGRWRSRSRPLQAKAGQQPPDTAGSALYRRPDQVRQPRAQGGQAAAGAAAEARASPNRPHGHLHAETTPTFPFEPLLRAHRCPGMADRGDTKGVAGARGKAGGAGGAMTGRVHSIPQLDLFVPALSDVQLRDQRDAMERPFFSLSKRKRLTPINYVSPDGGVTVTVKPHQDYGMPTIWDADLLIWAASTLNDMKNRGVNDIPRRLTAKPYELLKAIGRDAGGSDCRQLHEAALRLRNVSITTNRRSRAGEKPENFAGLDKVSVTKRGGEEGGNSRPPRSTITALQLVLRRRPRRRRTIDRPCLSCDHGGQGALALPRRLRKHDGGTGQI